MKLSKKLTKVGDNFTVYMYDNGFMFEINGRDSNDNWVCSKVICNSLEDLNELVKEATEMERD